MPRDWYAWLIDPLTPQDFERGYYERRPCHIARDATSYYRDLLTVADLDTVLGTHAVRHPDISLVMGEAKIDPSEYTNDVGRIRPLDVARRFDDGATIVFQQLHRRVPALARLCVALGQRFASRIQTNVYLTPPNAQGFAPHWDTHDVFVLQIAGQKHWTIYDTKVTLPLRGQRFEPGSTPPGEVSDTFDVEVGSVLYVPRGVMHAARSTRDASVHITLGITAFTWADFLIESVAAAALDDESLRQNLPVSFAREECPAAEREQMYRDKLSTVLTRFDPRGVWEHLKDEVLATNEPLFLDLLSQRLDSAPPALESRLHRREDLVVRAGIDGEVCVIRFGSQQLRLPAAAWPAVEFAVRTREFRVDELPDCLDADGKLALATRLVREGILQRSAAAADSPRRPPTALGD